MSERMMMDLATLTLFRVIVKNQSGVRNPKLK